MFQAANTSIMQASSIKVLCLKLKPLNKIDAYWLVD